jgi:hypothetical protein
MYENNKNEKYLKPKKNINSRTKTLKKGDVRRRIFYRLQTSVDVKRHQ